MKITVVIPNFNGLHFLETCLSSLDNQNFKAFSIILVDNGSTDGSLEYVRKHYPAVEIIQNLRNLGFAKAVNQGIRMSKTEYVALLNNDVEVDENWMGALYDAIKSDPKVFSVSSRMVRFQERDRMDDAGDLLTLFGWAFKRGDGEAVAKYAKPADVFSSCAGAAIYRRKIFRKIGLFDERFFAYFEDVDIGYRARVKGYRNIYCPEAVVYHIASGTSGSKYNNFKVRHSSRNEVYLIHKNMPWLQQLVNCPFLMTGFLVKCLYFISKGYGKAYLTGKAEALRTLKGIGKTKSSCWTSYLLIERDLIANTFHYLGFFLRKLKA